MITAGVDLGGTKTLAASIDGAGSITHRVHIPTDAADGTTSAIEAARQLFDEVEQRPDALGVAVAAWVTHPEGKVIHAPNLNFTNPEVKSAVEAAFDVPIVVENDAAAAAWGESRFGVGKGASNYLMLTVGTGVGGGTVIDGELYRGSIGLASEFGHITILEGGPECACGQRGCLEALASGTAIARMAREAVEAHQDSSLAATAKEITGEIVATAAADGDEVATAILRKAGHYLGVGMVSLIQSYDPELVVIGGGAADPLIIDAAKQVVTDRLPDDRPKPGIEIATLGNDAGVIGVADLAARSER